MAARQLLPLCWRATLTPVVSTASRARVCARPSAWVCHNFRVTLIYYPLNPNTPALSGGSLWVASRAPAFSRVLGRISCRAAAASSGQHGIRHYYQSTRGAGEPQHHLHIVDLRSDTLSTPSAEMRNAMGRAEVGDDVYGEDPTVNEFQQQVAKILGTEDALFVTSGTMGNLVSVMCHCRNRGEELLVGDQAHLYLYEQGGVAQIAGVSPRLVTNLSNGQLDLEELESKIQKEYPDPHYARTRLICLENTHNRTGGRILPLSHLREVRLLADRYGLAVHLDGARLINAAVALGVAPAEIVQYCDSVSLCLTKGLGAPVGAVIGGRREFIKECLRARKVLGGGMRQAGILAAAGLLALSQAEDTCRADHHRAKKFATGVQQLASPVCSVDLPSVETNMVMLVVNEPRICPQEFCERMWDVSEAEILELGRGVKVRMFVMYKRTVRLVWYRNISEEDTEMALNKLKFVVQQYSAELGIV
ncbi:hypothetical protein NDU88_007193 [Pleurodeles waltl]|uniref:Aromatic amino acid beta-eliminating lyase/threonine aldolase domain-containing protein n=1 Tax=Pleurodeles waltl TaxID=8319 RepID=A0AAV7PLT5_PLEWA|nr:hypothetical protein NDU88_007193 [Pleurodeles waltl]